MLRINRPEALTNLTINAIGANYLSAHNKKNKNAFLGFFDSLAHSNHAVAIEMANYDKESSCYDKWLFLANLYVKLVNNSGELANNIKCLFRSGFKTGLWPYALINFNLDDCHYETGSFNSRHISQFSLFTMINNYWSQVFKSKINDFDLSVHVTKADNISNELIQYIGKVYLNKYGVEETYQHDNQASAKRLVNYNEESDAHAKWLFLADVYKSLTESRGDLSKSIIELFKDRFAATVYTHSKNCHYHAPYDVGEALKGIANNHYALKYRKVLEQILQLGHGERPHKISPANLR